MDPKSTGTTPSSGAPSPAQRRGAGTPKLAGACSSLPPCGCPPRKLRGATSTTGAAPPPWPAPTLGCGVGMGGVFTHPWSPPRRAWGTRRVQVPGGNAAAARPRWRRKHLRHPPAPGAGVAAGPPTPGVTPTRCHRAPVPPCPAAPAPRHGGVLRGAAWVRGRRHHCGCPTLGSPNQAPLVWVPLSRAPRGAGLGCPHVGAWINRGAWRRGPRWG